jgi:hypothetical protein
MKSITALLILVLAVFLVACGNKAADQPAPVVPAPQEPTPAPAAPEPAPPAVAPAKTEVAEAVTGTDKAFGDAKLDSEDVLAIDEVRCDKETRTLTFRFANNDAKKWQLDQKVPFPAPRDMEPARIFLNRYEMNGPTYWSPEKEMYFGPSETFSDNCGGVEVLEPGQDVTCTVSPVPLAQETELKHGNEQIFIDTPTSHHVLSFTC